MERKPSQGIRIPYDTISFQGCMDHVLKCHVRRHTGPLDVAGMNGIAYFSLRSKTRTINKYGNVLSCKYYDDQHVLHLHYIWESFRDVPGYQHSEHVVTEGQ